MFQNRQNLPGTRLHRPTFVLIMIMMVTPALVSAEPANPTSGVQKVSSRRRAHRHPPLTNPPAPCQLIAGPDRSEVQQASLTARPIRRQLIQMVSAVETVPELQPVPSLMAPPSLEMPQSMDMGAEVPYCPPQFNQGPTTIPWEVFAQGEYIGPSRTAHLPEYRVRVDDVLNFVYRITREAQSEPYRLKVGDVLKVESLTAEKLNHTLTVEPDGMITVPLAGRLSAAGQTIDELRQSIEQQVSVQVRDPAISVMPVELDQRLEELRATVDNRSAAGGQSFEVTVAPDGMIQLPAIGSVPVVGLSLNELNSEVSARYSALFPGMDVTSVLRTRAPRNVYVLGEVRTAGRYSLVAPTTALQAISLAGGHLIGADLCNVVVLRRDENWRLIATQIDLRNDLRGNYMEQSNDIWLRDSDILLVPKSTCQRIDEYIDLVLTRGVYGVVPIRYALNYTRIIN